MSDLKNRPGITPEDVLKQIDYDNIKKDIPEPENKVVSGSAQSCPTLCHPVDCCLPGSSVHGVF